MIHTPYDNEYFNESPSPDSISGLDPPGPRTREFRTIYASITISKL